MKNPGNIKSDLEDLVSHITSENRHNEVPEIPVQINAPNDLDVCTWTDDADEKRRAFVVNQMSCGDIDGKVLVENMHAVCNWLKSGALPTTVAPILRPSPKAVA